MGQKIPLFGGVIVPAPRGATTPVFTPPDKDSDAPSIYEVSLFILPRVGDTDASPLRTDVRAREGANPGIAVWRAFSGTFVDRDPVARALDGYPIRGDVTLEVDVSMGVPAADPATEFMWGYYQRVGQGDLSQPARRPIGQALTPFNAGVPFVLLPGESVIVHVFEPNRIDEISLAAFFSDNPAAATDRIEVTFEDVGNVVIGSVVPFRPRTSIAYSSFASGRTVPPQGSFFPPSPYLIHQCPFGGGGVPTLHHLRVKDASGGGVFTHGYFTRR